MSEMTRRSLGKLERALDRLEEAAALGPNEPLAIDGTVQRFEFVFELFWKTFKRALQDEGVEALTPRSAIEAAFAAGWLADEGAWLDMLRDRNQTSHTYDQEKAEAIYKSIVRNLPAMRSAFETLSVKVGGSL